MQNKCGQKLHLRDITEKNVPQIEVCLRETKDRTAFAAVLSF